MNPERINLKEIANSQETKAAAIVAAAVVTTAIGHQINAETTDKLMETAGLSGALAITYALMTRTLESAYRRHRNIAGIGFIGTAALVADTIYNIWS